VSQNDSAAPDTKANTPLEDRVIPEYVPLPPDLIQRFSQTKKGAEAPFSSIPARGLVRAAVAFDFRIDFQQFYFEYQRFVGTNFARGTSCAIS
jgi:hypothetical protein